MLQQDESAAGVHAPTSEQVRPSRRESLFIIYSKRKIELSVVVRKTFLELHSKTESQSSAKQPKQLETKNKI